MLTIATTSLITSPPIDHASFALAGPGQPQGSGVPRPARPGQLASNARVSHSTRQAALYVYDSVVVLL